MVEMLIVMEVRGHPSVSFSLITCKNHLPHKYMTRNVFMVIITLFLYFSTFNKIYFIPSVN